MDQICATQSQREAVHDQEEQKSAKKGGKQLAKALNTASDRLELDQEDLESVSVAGSKMSGRTGKTTKTTSGALDRHCNLCANKKISGTNWNTHRKKMHKEEGKDFKGPQCTGADCQLCEGKQLTGLTWCHQGLTWVLLGGTRVLLGGTRVLLGGTKVLLGGTKVLLGGTKVLLGGTKVLLYDTRSYLVALKMVQGGHGLHRKVECQQCRVAKRSTLVGKDTKLCKVCSKRPNTEVNVEISPLTSQALGKLQKRPVREVVQQNNQIEHIDTRSQLKRADSEFEYNQQTEDGDYFEMPMAPPKRIKTNQPAANFYINGGNSAGTEMNNLSLTKVVETFGSGDINPSCLYNKLQEIESSIKVDYVLSLAVAKVCSQFSTPSALSFLKSRQFTKLPALISMMLTEQASQFNHEQLAGLFIAGFTLQGLCWISAVAMLQECPTEVQGMITAVFKAHLENAYDSDIAQWCITYWRNLEEQQLNVIKQLKGVDKAPNILLLSLAVQIKDIEFFVVCSSELVQRNFMQYLLSSAQARLKQVKLSTEQFLQLTQLVQQKKILAIVENNADAFENTPLSQWHSKIELFKASSHLMNSDSIQAAVEQYIAAYGDVEPVFANDMFTADSSLGLLLHESKNKPNAKQIGLAQYCIGILRRTSRQLWCVPSGQGKSRIIAFVAAIAINTQMFTKVHISFENKHLKDRDFKDFESLWILLGCQEKVQYHVGYDFPTDETELIIVDESDTAMFESPEKFDKLIDGKACICFTATPDNCDGKGVEAQVIQALHFKQYAYVPDAEPIDAAVRLQFDDVHHVSSTEDKVKLITTLVASGSVIVYGSEDLKEQLLAVASAGTIVINQDADCTLLRQLDQVPYKILFNVSQFGMRGLDYRSEITTLYLVVAHGFDCTREALQGMARVGRFGDPYKRIKFSDVELVDIKQQLIYNAKLFKYVADLRKKIFVKPVKVKQAQPSAKGGYNSAARKNLAARQVVASQNATNQLKLSFGGNSKMVPNQQ